MAQPTLKATSSRSRLGRSGMPSSRSVDRLHMAGAENPAQSTSAMLRNKTSRTALSSNASSIGKAAGQGVERRRPALGDKTNMQNPSHGAGQSGADKGHDQILKHKMPTSTHTNGNPIATRREVVIAKQRPQSAVAVGSSSKLAAEPTLTASNSYAGGRHLRGASSSSGTSLSRQATADVNMQEDSVASSQRSSVASTASALTVAPRRGSQASSSRRALQLTNRSMDTDETAITVSDETSSFAPMQHAENHLIRPKHFLNVRAPSPGTSADDDMSEAESEWQSSSMEGPISSKTDTDDEGLIHKAPGSALGSSDEEVIEYDEDEDEVDLDDEDDASDLESLSLSSLDPDCLISLPPGLEELARAKVDQICGMYENAVLQPLVMRQAMERQTAVSRGDLSAENAAHDDELALMGLDPDEVRDTSMVAEYSVEIFEYMSKCECRTMANPNYMDFQGEIRWHMRATLVDWLMQVHMRYHMMPETLWIAINVVDRFLSARVVSLAKLQLVGVTAMFIAAKYEEILAPSVEEFVFMTENGYTRDEILKGERIILSTLDFNISGYCSPYSWVRRISKADDYDIQTRTLAKFLMELTLFDHRFLRAKPSLIAAVAMYLSKKMLGGTWNEAFVYYSRLVEEQLIPGANLLLERLVDDSFLDCFVCKKYGNRKFLKASIFARDWALRNQETMLVASASVASSFGTSGTMDGSELQVENVITHSSSTAAVY